MIPKAFELALKNATKDRKSKSDSTPKMLNDINQIIDDIRKYHPEVFRERSDGSVLPRVVCHRL